MSYVDRVLEPDEKVLYSTRLHWRSHLPAVFFLAMAIGCAIAGAEIDNHLPVLAAAAVFVVLAIAAWIPAAIRRSSSEFVVTDRRVLPNFTTNLLIWLVGAPGIEPGTS